MRLGWLLSLGVREQVPPPQKKTALLFMGPICKGKDFAFQT